MRATYGRADCKAAASLLDLDASHPVMHTYPYIFWNCGTWEALKHLKDLDIIVSPKQCARDVDRPMRGDCVQSLPHEEAASGAGEPPHARTYFFPRIVLACYRTSSHNPQVDHETYRRKRARACSQAARPHRTVRNHHDGSHAKRTKPRALQPVLPDRGDFPHPPSVVTQS